MARQARCNRVHSALTHQVNVIEAEKVNVHAVVLKFASGQLPFLATVLFVKLFLLPYEKNRPKACCF